MNRREFFALFGGAAVSWPLAAGAQQPERMRRIGMLTAFVEGDPQGQSYIAEFRGFSRSSGGRRAATTGSTLAGRRATRYRRHDSREELVALQPDLILSQNHTEHCGAAATNARHPYRVRSDRRSGRQRPRREFRFGRAATSPVFINNEGLDRRQVAGAARKRSRRASRRSPSCSIRQRRRTPNITSIPSKPPLRPLRWSGHRAAATRPARRAAIAAQAREPNGRPDRDAGTNS